MKLLSLLTCCVLVSVASQAETSQPLVGWRNDGTGVYRSESPPTRWSKKDNVVWSTKMPSRSNSLPVIVGDQLFVCSEPFTLLSVRLSDGKILWQRQNSYKDVTSKEQMVKVGKEVQAAAVLHKRRAGFKSKLELLNEQRQNANNTDEIDKQIAAVESDIEEVVAKLATLPLAARYTLPLAQPQYNGYSTASPTSDGQRVCAVFGNRVTVCFDLEGNRQWAHVLPDNPQSMWGHSSSPLMVADKLIVNIDGIEAFDVKTGKSAWRTKYGQSWGSPVRARIGDEDVIALANGRILRASDGKRLTRLPTLERASPVIVNETAYYIGVRAAAFKFPAKIGDSIELAELWTVEPKGSLFSASPVVDGGLVYAVSTQKILNVIDAATGKLVYVKRLNLGDGPVWPSLCIAGSYLYVSSRNGTTLVIKTGRQHKEVSKNTLEYFISTPVFHQNRMYVRTNQRLYCIGE